MINFDPDIDPRDLVQMHHEERTKHIDEHYSKNKWRLIWWFVVVFAVWVAADYLFSLLPNRPGAAIVTVSAPLSASPPELCPGDVLEYTYRVDADQNGVVDIDTTLYRVSPPQTLIYSVTLRDILIDPEHRELQTVWQIPSEVTNPLTGQTIPLTKGAYQRRISVSTSSRNTTPTITKIDFEIRAGC